MDRRASHAAAHGVAKSQTWLSDWTHTHTRLRWAEGTSWWIQCLWIFIHLGSYWCAGYFLKLIVVMLVWLSKYTNNDCILHFKWMNCVLHEFVSIDTFQTIFKKKKWNISIKLLKVRIWGTSLVVQHLGICLPQQGTWPWSLVWADSVVPWSNWAHLPWVLKPVHPRARAPQQESGLH